MSDKLTDGGPACGFAALGMSNSKKANECEAKLKVTKHLELRDWFAGQAMMGWLSNPKCGESLDRRKDFAFAYEIADAMLAERQKRGDDES